MPTFWVMEAFKLNYRKIWLIKKQKPTGFMVCANCRDVPLFQNYISIGDRLKEEKSKQIDLQFLVWVKHQKHSKMIASLQILHVLSKGQQTSFVTSIFLFPLEEGILSAYVCYKLVGLSNSSSFEEIKHKPSLSVFQALKFHK